MAETFGDILPFAIGIAISPVPIIAVILVLFSSRARINGPAFLIGWIVGIAVVMTAVLLLADAGDVATDSDASTGVAWGKLALGLVLILLGVRQWRVRPAPGEEAHLPEWMASVDGFSPAKSFGTGIVLSAVNPKNLILAAGAGATIAQAGLAGSKDVAVAIAFVLVASVTVAGSVLFYLVGGARAQHVLDGWKTWLTQNNATVMSVLLVVIGAVLFGEGFDVFD